MDRFDREPIGKIYFLDQIKRTLDLTITEILTNDVNNGCFKTNDGVTIRLFYPNKHVMIDALSFDPKPIKVMYDVGKETAAEVLSKK